MNGAVKATPDNIDQVELVYEVITCTRCGGTGLMPYSRSRGMCYGCGGDGKKRTPAGKRAHARFEELSRAMLPVLRDEVAVGDRIFQYVPEVGLAWVEVVGRDVDDLTEWLRSEGRIGPDETRHQLMLKYVIPGGDRTYWAAETMARGYTVPRWDPAKLADIYNTVAKLKGATVRLRSDVEGAAR